jgi:capsular exopolysaccharide synthesis family protein
MTPSTASPSGDLRSYGKAFWRWKWLFLFFLLATPIAAYLLSARNPKVYEASAQLQVQGAPALGGSLGSESPPATEQTVQAAARLVRTSGVASLAAAELRPRPRDPRSLVGSITTEADTTAGFLTIRARAPTPRRAADLANAFANGFTITRRRQGARRLDTGIRRLETQLDQLSLSDRDSRRALAEDLQRLRAIRATQGANADVVEPARPPGAPVSPRPGKTAALGLIVGILLGLAAVVLASNLDRRLRRPDELEETLGLPLLSALPRSAFNPRRSGQAGWEAAQTLRASLTYFNIDRPLSTVLVTSPAQGEGKTTVATDLSRALAHGGLDTILVDADLRRPGIAQRLGIDAGPGLGSVLVGEVALGEALIALRLDPTSQGRLRVLPAGSSPPNPAELIASDRMRQLLAALREEGEAVVIDTNPILPVSDTIPLLEQVSGIVVVGRMGVTKRDALVRMRDVIVNAQGTMLGVVATGAESSGLYGYGYGYVPANGAPSRGRFGRRRARAHAHGEAEVEQDQPPASSSSSR